MLMQYSPQPKKKRAAPKKKAKKGEDEDDEVDDDGEKPAKAKKVSQACMTICVLLLSRFAGPRQESCEEGSGQKEQEGRFGRGQRG